MKLVPSVSAWYSHKGRLTFTTGKSVAQGFNYYLNSLGTKSVKKALTYNLQVSVIVNFIASSPI